MSELFRNAVHWESCSPRAGPCSRQVCSVGPSPRCPAPSSTRAPPRQPRRHARTRSRSGWRAATRAPTGWCSGPGWRSTRSRTTGTAGCRRACSPCSGRWRPTHRFARVVRSGTVPAWSVNAHSVHVELARPAAGPGVLLPVPAGRHLSPRRTDPDRPGAVTPCLRRWPWRSSPAPSTSTATSPPTGGWPRTTRTWCCTSATTSTSTRRQSVLGDGNPRGHVQARRP